MHKSNNKSKFIKIISIYFLPLLRKKPTPYNCIFLLEIIIIRLLKYFVIVGGCGVVNDNNTCIFEVKE